MAYKVNISISGNHYFDTGESIQSLSRAKEIAADLKDFYDSRNHSTVVSVWSVHKVSEELHRW